MAARIRSIADRAGASGQVAVLLETLFVVSVALAVYPYVIYPWLLPLLARLVGRPAGRRDWTPTVSLLIPVYNERAVIARKLENSLALDYPRDRLEIVVGSDGSTDGTPAIIQPFTAQGVRFLDFRERRGKPSVLAELAAAARGEILVPTDASALLAPQALRELVTSFDSDAIGVVSGEELPSTLDLYRRLDNMLRRYESRLHSSSGAAGALYGIRRHLFHAPPPDTILDDIVIPLRTVERGYRLIIQPAASFSELEPTSLRGEFRRKVRTLAGNYQALLWLWPLFLPGRSPVWFTLISHKLLRLATPYLMLLLIPLNLAVADRPLFRGALGVQALFYLCAGLGFVVRHRPIRILFLHYPFLFLTMQTANLCSLFMYVSGRVTMKWQRQSLATPPEVTGS